jgi:hypothetical protein
MTPRRLLYLTLPHGRAAIVEEGSAERYFAAAWSEAKVAERYECLFYLRRRQGGDLTGERADLRAAMG